MSLSPGTKGAINELRVAGHLLSLGFDVPRMLSPNSSADLLVARGRRVLRVQVKSTLSLNQLKNRRASKNDLLAVIVDGQLHYRAVNRRVQAMVPGSTLARRPKRQLNSHTKRQRFVKPKAKGKSNEVE